MAIVLYRAVLPNVTLPYRAIETFTTTDGIRSRVCAGGWATIGDFCADSMFPQYEKSMPHKEIADFQTLADYAEEIKSLRQTRHHLETLLTAERTAHDKTKDALRIFRANAAREE